MRRDVILAAGPHEHAVDATIRAAHCAERPEAAVVHDEGRARLAPPQRDSIANAETAALAPGPGRALGERVFLEQHRVELLDNLERRRLRDADRRAAIRDAVEPGAAAITAAADQVHDIIAALLRVPAAKREIAARPRRRCEQPLWDRLDERREDRLGDALRHFRGTAGDRARIAGVKEGPVGIADVQRRESAGIYRHLGTDVLD